MSGVKAMLEQMRALIGTGEPAGGNAVQKWYRGRNGNAYGGNFPWCQATVTYAAYRSGNHKQVCPKGDRAYTVWAASDHREAGATWRSGTADNLRKYARPGSIVFFDWGGSNTLGMIDHVGVCERNLGDGRIITIEGNTGNVCARRVRDSRTIAGFWTPRYPDPPAARKKPASKPAGKPAGKAATGPEHITVPSGRVPISAPASGPTVKDIQRALIAAGHKLPKHGADGKYGPETTHAIRALQRHAKITVDGVYGPQTARALKEAREGVKG